MGIVNCVVEGNAFKLRAADWVPLDAWNGAPVSKRNDWLKLVAARAVELKREELKAGTGVDGRALRPVKMKYRRDHAKGPPLIPHETVSRSWKWIRYSLGSRHLTFWWSHGWGKILGYHARGLVRGAPKRDVIGLAVEDVAALEKYAKKEWRRLNPTPFKLRAAPVRDQGRLTFGAQPRPAPAIAEAVKVARANAAPQFRRTAVDPALVRHVEPGGNMRGASNAPNAAGHFVGGWERVERIRPRKGKAAK